MNIPEVIGFTNLLLFALAVIGMTNIIVDGAIFSTPREWLKEHLPTKLFQLISCYQCCGTWCGFILGAMLICYWNPFVIFACGMAGSFLAAGTSVFLTYLEARSIVDLNLESDNEQEVPPTV